MSEISLFEIPRITKVSKEIVEDVVSLLRNVKAYEGVEAMSVSEIAERFANEMPYAYGKDVNVIKDRVCNVLSSHLKKKLNGKLIDNAESLVVRVKNNKGGYKKGVYKLRPQKLEKPIIKVDSGNKLSQKQELVIGENVSTTNIGKGGEMAVMSELLFRGYNPALAVVDNGIDVFATKDKGFFQFQVKTTEWKNNQATVHIDKNSFARYNTSNTYYIIVIRYVKDKIWTNQYFIFSSSEIQKLIHTGYISNNERNYSIKLIQEDGDIKASNRGNKTSVGYHLDNWALVSEWRIDGIGIDPEILAIGTEMAVYHIEKGARKFAEYARVMIEDLGDVIRPYLKAFYNGARDLPEVAENGLADDMTPYNDVQEFDVW